MNHEKRRTILLVEDESLLATTEKMALEDLGYAVITAKSGEKAIEVAGDRAEIDLVLMDMDLGDGIDGAKAAAAILESRDLPIVFLSSLTEKELAIRTMTISCYGYVTKNSGTTALDASIKNALKLFDAREKSKSLRVERMALAASEAKYRRFFEAAREGILILDAESGRIADVNPFMAALSGYPREAFLGRAIWEIEALWGLVANEEDYRALRKRELLRSGHIPIRTAQGVLVDTELIGASYPVGGRQTIQLVLRDLADRKLAEKASRGLIAERELMLKEEHHRIKNDMMAVAGLLSLQAEAIGIPAAATALFEAEGRIRSLMVLYDKLYLSDSFKSVSILEYLPSLIGEILARFPDSPSIKVTRKIDDFSLSAKTLQPICIIINELLTNAMNHAFASGESGAISVSVLQEGSMIALAVEDDGRGMPEPVDLEGRAGFGLTLVGLLARQLGGTLRIESEKGTKVVLEFEI